MSMINGIGFGYLGQSAVKSDGSYVATKWFCLVLPLIPAGSYRIWPESSRSARPCRAGRDGSAR